MELTLLAQLLVAQIVLVDMRVRRQVKLFRMLVQLELIRRVVNLCVPFVLRESLVQLLVY